MKAWVVDQWTDPEGMQLKDVPVPEPGSGEALIRVKAAAVNFFDALQIAGKYQHKPDFPFTPGGEVAGIVEKAPAGSRLKEGSRVMAMVPSGGYAEYCVANQLGVAPIPDSMPFDEAAAFPIVYQTSYFGLVHRAHLKDGERLLVHAGAGGVGSAAIQIGKALGAKVIATAGSEEKLDVCRDLGADHALNYKDDGWQERVLEITAGHGADVIYDPVGGDIFDLSLKCIAWEGRLVVIGFASGRIPEVKVNRVLLKNIAIVGLHFGEYRKHNPQLIVQSLFELFKLYEEGRVKPLVSKTYSLEEAPQAMRDIAGRSSHGKLIIEP